MSETFGLAHSEVGEAGLPAFPEYPQFAAIPVPGPLTLETPTGRGTSTSEEVNATQAWHGLITPFASDEDARLAVRLLAADRSFAVHGGTLVPGPEAFSMDPHPAESRLSGTDLTFDILIAEFDPPAHPWGFSLSPPIYQRLERFHPHLRSDRSLKLSSRTLHGFCVYSSAEFAFDVRRAALPQFLDQVAIFLAKHVVWLKTLRLFSPGGDLVHDGINTATLMSGVPSDSVCSVVPRHSTRWIGFWPGSSAVNDAAHLSLDPEGQCWCGKGKQYKDCCLPWEKVQYTKSQV